MKYLNHKISNKEQIEKSTAETLVKNYPEQLKSRDNAFKETNLLNEFQNILDAGYHPASILPYYEANKYNACFYLFINPFDSNDMILTTCCTRHKRDE